MQNHITEFVCSTFSKSSCIVQGGRITGRGVGTRSGFAVLLARRRPVTASCRTPATPGASVVVIDRVVLMVEAMVMRLSVRCARIGSRRGDALPGCGVVMPSIVSVTTRRVLKTNSTNKIWQCLRAYYLVLSWSLSAVRFLCDLPSFPCLP